MSNSNANVVHLCVTTTPRSNWRKQIKDLDYYHEETVSVFPTFLKPEERKELYELLLNSKIKNIPHVHLRGDMAEEEAIFFIKNFQTKVFTIHAADFDKFTRWKISKQLFLELACCNQKLDLSRLRRIGGLCADLSHFTMSKKLKTLEYACILKGAEKHKVGINHIGGMLKNGKSSHFIYHPRDFDYLKEIPEKLISPCPCLEVENSIEKQIKYRKYVQDILK